MSTHQQVGQSLAFGNDRGARGSYSPFPSSRVQDRALLALWRPRALTRTPLLQWDYNCFIGREKAQDKHFRTGQHPEANLVSAGPQTSLLLSPVAAAAAATVSYTHCVLYYSRFIPPVPPIRSSPLSTQST
ncbi:hypothetical protein PAMP_005909 [Pampus punctatissimus]